MFNAVNVGERIKKVRKAAGLTQAQLAKRLNVTRGYIGNVEQNQYSPSLAVLQRIADALQIDIAEFVSKGVEIQETGLTNEELHLVLLYRSLNDDSKRLTTAMLSKLAQTQNARYSTSISNPIIRTRKVAMGG